MKEKDLLELKKSIDAAKQEVSELKGREKQLLHQLREQWNTDLPGAKKKIAELMEELRQLDNKIAAGIKELEEKYEIN